MATWGSVQRTLVLVACWAFYNLGACIVNVIITNEAFLETYANTPARLGVFVAAPLIGSVINSLGLGGLLNRRFGRRRTFQLACLCTLVAICFQTIPFRAFWPLVLGRVVFGFSGNLNARTLGLYLSEISDTKDRGRTTFLGVSVLPATISILSNIVAWATSFLPTGENRSWRIANAIQVVPGVIFLGLTFLLPESPRWIASQRPDDHDGLLDAIARLRDKQPTDPEIKEEAADISDNVHGSGRGEIQPLRGLITNRHHRKRLLLAAGALAAGVSAGYPILSSYAVVFFQDLVTHTQRGALLLNAAIAVIYSAANLSSAAIVERVGRRTLARAYMTVNIVLLATIATLALTFKDSRPVAYSIVALIVLDMTAFQSLWTGTVEVFSNEILPNDFREIGIGLANILPLGISFGSTQLWPLIQANLQERAWLIILIPATIAAIGVWTLWPETGGVSLEALETMSQTTASMSGSEAGDLEADDEETPLARDGKVYGSTRSAA